MIEHIEIKDGDLPPEPIAVPKATKPGESWEHCEVISAFLKISGLDLRGCSPEGMAQYVFVYCQGAMVTQQTLDRALKWSGILQAASEHTDEIENPDA